MMKFLIHLVTESEVGQHVQEIACLERKVVRFVWSPQQRIGLIQLAALPDREAFWTLFNESVSPLTSYRIETHSLQLQPNLFKA